MLFSYFYKNWDSIQFFTINLILILIYVNEIVFIFKRFQKKCLIESIFLNKPDKNVCIKQNAIIPRLKYAFKHNYTSLTFALSYYIIIKHYEDSIGEEHDYFIIYYDYLCKCVHIL